MTSSAGPPGKVKKTKKCLNSGPLLTQQQMAKFQQAIIKTPSILNPSQASNNWIMTTTGTTQPQYNRENEVKRIIKKHSKGYYYTISVNDVEDVFFKAYRANKLGYWLHKVFRRVAWGEKITPPEIGYNPVRRRSHLPATLGAAYQEIDRIIADHKASLEHDDYISEMLKTSPENLKMIEGLERLENPEPEAAEDTSVGTAGTFIGSGAGTTGGGRSAMSVSGAGTFVSGIAANGTIGWGESAGKAD